MSRWEAASNPRPVAPADHQAPRPPFAPPRESGRKQGTAPNPSPGEEDQSLPRTRSGGERSSGQPIPRPPKPLAALPSQAHVFPLSPWRPLQNSLGPRRCGRSYSFQGESNGVRCQSIRRDAGLSPLLGERQVPASSPETGEGSSGPGLALQHGSLFPSPGNMQGVFRAPTPGLRKRF